MKHLLLLLLISLTAALSAVSCSGHLRAEKPKPVIEDGEVFLAASIKSWLVDPLPSYYYSPEAVYRTVYHQWDNNAPYELYGSLSAGFTKPTAMTKIPSLELIPQRNDLLNDLESFIAALPLKRIAAACYGEQPGKIYVLPGRQIYIHSKQKSKFVKGPGEDIVMGARPYRFMTKDSLDLSKLTDNILLLYQLHLDYKICILKRGEEAFIEWKDIAYVQLSPENEARGQAQSVNLLSRKYPALGLIKIPSNRKNPPELRVSYRMTKEPIVQAEESRYIEAVLALREQAKTHAMTEEEIPRALIKAYEATARPHPDKVICKSEPWVLTTEAYRLLYQTFTPYLREAERKLLGKKPLKRLAPPGKGDKRSLTLYEWYTYHPLPSAPSEPEDSMRIPNPYSPEPYVIYEK